MPRYAAVDIGSNSVRMLAAEVLPGVAPRVLTAERQVTRLGESVFQNGEISQQAMDLTCEVLRRFANAYNNFEIAGVRAVATSAVRDARNQRRFLEAASEALGTSVEIISGQEEARLIHLGVQSRWPHPKQRILVIDIGGGSAELILGEGGRMTAAYSKPLGAVRLTEVFIKHDPPTAQELHRLERFIVQKLTAATKRFGLGPWDRAIATSATAAAVVCAVNRVARARRDSADRLRVTPSQLRALYQRVSQSDLGARRKIAGVGPRRAEIIIPGAAVLRAAVERFHLPSLYYSAAGLRDGIVADLAARGVGKELSRLSREQRDVVEQMARRYGVDVRHTRKVASLAHTLFESLHSLHGLGLALGRLLEAAAYLHDTGHFISDIGHHKHSAYVVANSDMPTFTDRERVLVAMLCRYHRKTMPSPRHEAFQALSVEEKRAVLMLTPLLRLADSLDRSHDQRVESVACQIRESDVRIDLGSTADTDLEIWAGERAGEVFREIYGLPITLVKARR
jgi:exopolyphosphatase/guanosine-5'-triphosphate,3'-diphosphate pyrophosphatase